MAIFSRRISRWVVGLVALAMVVIAVASRVDAQGFPFAFPVAPPGTPQNYVPLTADTKGNVTWGTAPAGALSPGSAGQVLTTPNGALTSAWKVPATVSVVDAYGAKCDGATDDSAVIGSCLTATSGSGTCCFIPACASPYVVANPINLTSNTCIVSEPGAVIHSTMSNTGAGGFTHAVFFATQTGVGANNNLTSSASLGSHTISVTSAVSVGSTIALGVTTSGNLQQQATVTATSGSGPYTLTLDEEVMSNYFTTGAGAFVYTYTPPHNILLMGNGLKVWGTGDRVVEVAFARDVYVDRIITDPTLGPTGNAGFLNIQYSFDIAGRDVGFSRIRADGGSGYLTSPIGTVGIALEASNRGYIRDSESQNFRAPGDAVMLLDARNSLLENVGTRNSSVGRYYGSNDSFGTEGSREITDVGGTSTGNAIGWEFDKASEVYVYNPSSIGDTNSLASIATATVFFRDVDAKAPASGAYNFLSNNGGHLYLSGRLDLSTGAGTTTISDWAGPSGGTLHLDHFRTIGGTYGFYIETTAGTPTISAGDDVDISSVGTKVAGPGSVTFVDNPALDNTVPFGSSSLRWLSASAGPGGYSVYHASGDTQPSAQVADGDLLLGAGGSTTPSVQLLYSSASTAQLTNGSNGNATLAVGGTSSANEVVIASSSTSVDTASTGTRTLNLGTTNATTINAGSTATTAINEKVSSSGFVNVNSGGALATAQGFFPGSSTIGCSWYGTTSAGSPSTSNYSICADTVPNLYVGAGSTNVNLENSGALQPGGFGTVAIGASSLPFGATYLGASTTSGTGYTQFAATTGATNTGAHNVFWIGPDLETINSYSAKNFQSYTVAAHHGGTLTCKLTLRVVTAGSGGTCSFWATGVHGAPDTVYSCIAQSEGYYNGTSFSSYSSPFYNPCDLTGSPNFASGTTLTNPVATFGSSNSGGTTTFQWTIFNDSCSTPPVIAAVNRCEFLDD